MINNSNFVPQEDGLSIQRCKSGDSLFHYTNSSALINIIENGELWLTKSNCLNDKSEFIYCEDVIKKACDEFFAAGDTAFGKDFCDDVINDFNNSGRPDIIQGDYVLSFSLDRDNILLWSEYSNFMGYSIEFDYEKFKESLKTKGMIFDGFVIYDEIVQVSRLKQALALICNSYETEINGSDIQQRLVDGSIGEDMRELLLQNFSVYCTAYSMFFKKPCFSGENEYRFVIWAVHQDFSEKIIGLVPLNFRDKQNVIIPYIKVPIVTNDGLLPIRSITIGPQNNIDISETGLRFFLASKKYQIVSVNRSDIPLRY